MIVVLCLLMAVLGIDYVSSLQIIRTDFAQGSTESIRADIASEIILGRNEEARQMVKDYKTAQIETSRNIGIVAVSHSRGVLAQLVNGVSSGEMLEMIYSGIQTITRSKTASIVFFIFLSLLFIFLWKVFIVGVFKVTVKRIVMEYRFYDKVPMNRFLFLLSVRRARHVAVTLLLTGVYKFFWNLTIVGYFVKTYSYLMVPYIMAENPSIPAKRAITLSRKMMNGHKWEAFKLGLSFLGWKILEFFTFGISGMLFSNPYQELTRAEYYSRIRSLAKENQIPDAELLHDTYLYEKADKDLLKESYSDLQKELSEAEHTIVKHTGLRGFLENVFGIALFYDEDEKAFQQLKAKQLSMRNIKEICEQNMYPFRLFVEKHKERAVRLSQVQYDRHYTVVSLVLMFFTMSFIGWCWEVSLHLISDGVFINRGFFHGPWLPIYGFGGVFILVILYKFREKIFLEFLSAVVLCGFIEYFTAWYMELANGGTKWWDYTGYFLNIHGRICAEGLLVFGLGGLAIVYLLAPFLDNVYRRIPRKVTAILAIALIMVLGADTVYSKKNPNVGDGITNYTGMPGKQQISVGAEVLQTDTLQTETSLTEMEDK